MNIGDFSGIISERSKIIWKEDSTTEETIRAEEVTLAGEGISMGDRNRSIRRYVRRVRKNAKCRSSRLKEEKFFVTSVLRKEQHKFSLKFIFIFRYFLSSWAIEASVSL